MTYCRVLGWGNMLKLLHTASLKSEVKRLHHHHNVSCDLHSNLYRWAWIGPTGCFVFGTCEYYFAHHCHCYWGQLWVYYNDCNSELFYDVFFVWFLFATLGIKTHDRKKPFQNENSTLWVNHISYTTGQQRSRSRHFIPKNNWIQLDTALTVLSPLQVRE